MNKKTYVFLLCMTIQFPIVSVHTKPPMYVDDGTEQSCDDIFSLESLMKADDLVVSQPSIEKPSALKTLCQYVGLVVFMKIIDFKHWCLQSWQALVAGIYSRVKSHECK